jgi:hypothetical protein
MMELSLTYFDIRCALGCELIIITYTVHKSEYYDSVTASIFAMGSSLVQRRPTGSCMCILVCDLETSKRDGLDPIWALVSLKKEACNLYFLKDLHHCLSPASVFQPNTKVSVGTYVSMYCGTVEAIQHAKS